MFIGDYESLAKENTNFRKVLNTTDHSQVVAMCLTAGEDIGEETHPSNDQIFLIAEGSGEVMIDGESKPVEEDMIVVVPAGHNHNVTNTGSEELQLLTIYAPAAHPDGTVHPTKADAMAAKESQ